MYQRKAHWTGFREICYWGFFRKSAEKIRIWSKSVKNHWHFIQRPKYDYVVADQVKTAIKALLTAKVAK
jgi:ATP:corrinoid adenosyltransferase